MVCRRGPASIMPESFPSCFGEHRHAHFGMPRCFQTTQSSVICIYQTTVAGCRWPVSVTWCKTLLGQGFSVSMDESNCQYVCKIHIQPWLFWKKQGSKAVCVEGRKMEVFWNLSSAKYLCGPEPQEGFYVAVVCEREIILFLGDMQKEALKKVRVDPSLMVVTTLLSKKEHLFGRNIYSTKAQFGETGRTHDIAIECLSGESKEPQLCVKVDKQAVVQVQHLIWTFRGNQTILVDGVQIEVFWDVHNWLFNSSHGHAVFMFQTRSSPNEIAWLRELGFSHSPLLQWNSFKDEDKWFTGSSCASVLQWPNPHCFKDSNGTLSGFSLLLYAWKNE